VNYEGWVWRFGFFEFGGFELIIGFGDLDGLGFGLIGFGDLIGFVGSGCMIYFILIESA
jgi:hypothetical protein